MDRTHLHFLFNYLIHLHLHHCECRHSAFSMDDKKPREGLLFDPISPYFLKLSNHCEGSQNYYLWNREMTTMLIIRRKLNLSLEQLLN